MAFELIFIGLLKTTKLRDMADWMVCENSSIQNITNGPLAQLVRASLS